MADCDPKPQKERNCIHKVLRPVEHEQVDIDVVT